MCIFILQVSLFIFFAASTYRPAKLPRIYGVVKSEYPMRVFLSRAIIENMTIFTTYVPYTCISQSVLLLFTRLMPGDNT